MFIYRRMIGGYDLKFARRGLGLASRGGNEIKLGCRAAFQATADPGRHWSLPSRIPRPFAATGIGTKILRGCAFRRVSNPNIRLSSQGFSNRNFR